MVLLGGVVFWFASVFVWLGIASGEIHTRCTRSGLFAMTFDEGPSANIEELLRILHHHKVKATFHFVAKYLTSDQARHAAIRCRQAGHEIGIRSDPAWRLKGMDAEMIAARIAKSAALLQKITGAKVKFVRLDYDYDNASTIEALEKAGYFVTRASLDSNDYTKANVDTIIENFELSLESMDANGDSGISVQRDMVANSVAATPGIIQTILENNFKLVTLSECLGQKLPAGVGDDSRFVPANGGKLKVKGDKLAGKGGKAKKGKGKIHGQSANDAKSFFLTSGVALAACILGAVVIFWS